MPALEENARPSASGKGNAGPAGHDGLKKASFIDRFDVGAGANSMRGVTSESEVELEDGAVAGAESGTEGRGGMDANGDAKNACVLLPLEEVCSSELNGEG